MIKEISIIIPCYNEKEEILLQTINGVISSIEDRVEEFQIIVVDDGSVKKRYNVEFDDNVELIRHSKNKGYGAALKTGIKSAKYGWIGITDADGTYPHDQFHELFQFSNDHSMIIGARKWNQISPIRRFPKKILTHLASFLAGFKIPDLNSGMRIFEKKLALKFWNLYPNGFSFTSTITMGAITNDTPIKFHEIEYYTRVGDSSIHPIKDTISFFMLVTRMALYFNPKKFFVPISVLLLFGAVLRGIRDYNVSGSLGGISLILFFLAFQTFFFGILAEIINKTRIFLSDKS